MFDIIFKTVPAFFDGTNILLSCLSCNIAIFAFGFPYIYRSVNDLSNISSILTNRLKNKTKRKIYPKFLFFIFILNAISLIFPDSIGWCILSVILLLLHILYIKT